MYYSSDSLINLLLLDPPRFGWAAVGGVIELCPPHEKSRRKQSRKEYLEVKRKISTNERRKKIITRKKGYGELVFKEKDIFTKELWNRSSNMKNSSNIFLSSFSSGESQIKCSIKHLNAVENKFDDLDSENEVYKSPLTLSESHLTCAPLNMSIELDSELSISNMMIKKKKSLDRGCTENGVASDKTGSLNKLPGTRVEINDKIVDTENSLNKGENNSFNIFAYHRGIAGKELRDEKTGKILCPTEPTDTNHTWDQPQMKLKVTMLFPLEDTKLHDNGSLGEKILDCNATVIGIKSKKEKIIMGLFYYNDVVEWNLEDSSTPTPMTYAASVASEFGLSFCQTLELAASIQRQIDEFVRKNIQYRIPITVMDTNGIHRVDTPLIPPGFVVPKILQGGHRASNIISITKHSIIRNEPSKFSGKRKSERRYSQVMRYSRDCAIVPKHLLPKHGSISNPGGRNNPITYTVEQDYIDEVLARAKEESKEIIKSCAGRKIENGEEVGKSHIKSNYICHICHVRKPDILIFPCGKIQHGYCNNHCKSRLGFDIEELRNGLVLDYCPICCLQCICAKCARNVNSVAITFKKECERQKLHQKDITMMVLPLCTNTTILYGISRLPESSEKRSNSRMKRKEVVVSKESCTDEFFPPSKRSIRYRRKKSEESNSEQKLSIFKSKTQLSSIVQKVPQMEFPLEIENGMNCDPAQKKDYFTVYTPDGSFLDTKKQENIIRSNALQKLKEKWESSINIDEDGNVDYCLLCDKTGGLICCDKCPRSFHDTCLYLKKDELPDPWVCPRCETDSMIQEGDKMKGKTSLHIMVSIFEKNVTCDVYINKVLILSKIHEMIENLMKFDFGDVFKEPVDCNVLKDYREIIQYPMDLGTIIKNILNGSYMRRALMEIKRSNFINKHGVTIIDMVILGVLKDIELVWHNCLLYNCEGSAVYRMAEVLRRRSIIIQSCSFYDQLHFCIKQNLETYINKCHEKRQKVPNNSSKFWLPWSKNKIVFTQSISSNSRPVAVFDCETMMVVKFYSRISSAAAASLFLSRKGFELEFSNINISHVKKIIRKSAEDPSQLLFGYRWLYFDQLKEGKYVSNNFHNAERNVSIDRSIQKFSSDTIIEAKSHDKVDSPKNNFNSEPSTFKRGYNEHDRLESNNDSRSEKMKNFLVSNEIIKEIPSSERSDKDLLEELIPAPCKDNFTKKIQNIEGFDEKSLHDQYTNGVLRKILNKEKVFDVNFQIKSQVLLLDSFPRNELENEGKISYSSGAECKRKMNDMIDLALSVTTT